MLTSRTGTCRCALAAAAVALGAALVLSCGSATEPGEAVPGTPEEPDEPDGDPDPPKGPGDLTESEFAAILRMRAAIEQGLGRGKEALTDALNRLFEEEGISFRYGGSRELGLEYFEPAPEVECPFLHEREEVAEDHDCQALSDRAVVQAYAQLSNLKALHPLGEEFDEGRTDNEFWYEEGMTTGIDNESHLAVHHLRESEVCDRAPTPQQEAFLVGVETGRQVFTEELNRMLDETGHTIRYPDEVDRLGVCEVDQAYFAPARRRSLDRVEEVAEGDPLCEAFEPADPDQANDLQQMRSRYRQGIRQGTEREQSHAGEIMFREVPCTVVDPLVVDVRGDGVRLLPVTRGVRFDLFDLGEPVRTAWVGGDDALLALDADGNGTIDGGRELFTNLPRERVSWQVPTGFDNLARWDRTGRGGNADGVIDTRDEVFSRLRLWQDGDGDGVSDPGELHALPALGVAGIGLSSAARPDRELSHHGLVFRSRSGVERTGSAVGAVYDAWFRYGRAVPR